MSFGVGLGDIIMLLKGLGRVISTLKKEAVDEFRRYARTYERFVQLVRGLINLAREQDLQDHPDIKKALRDAKRLLRRYFGRISEFEPHLGPGRVKKSLLGAIAKVKWMRHASMLKELRQDLDRELGFLYLLVATMPRVRDAVATRIPTRWEYHVILVTQPPIHSYGVVSDQFCTPNDRPGAMPWDSTSTDSIPPILASLRFRRHFALCLIPSSIWNSETKTLAEKFEGQLFWDYHGDDTSSSRGTVWHSNTIRKINAILELGVALSGDEAADLCTEYYGELRRGWEYFNIWWNSADFTLSLACLLVQAEPARKCRAVMRRLTQLRQDEVITPRRESCRTSGSAGVAVQMGGYCLGVLASCVGLVGAPVTVPIAIALGASTWAAGSLVTEVTLENGGRREGYRASAIAKLQQSFPRLDELFT